MFQHVQMIENNLQLELIHQLEVLILINNRRDLCKCQKMINLH